MGKYLSKWLQQNGLFNSSCPGDSVFIYANYFNRTIDSAKIFADAAFPNCNISVHISSSENTIFPYLLKNVTEEFRETGVEDMRNKLDKVDLRDTYVLLNSLSDIANSKICETEGCCDLTKGKDEISLDIGNSPQVYGRIGISYGLADSLLMGFYEGFSTKELWGIHSYEDWRLITKVINAHLDIAYTWKNVNVYIKQLLEYFNSVTEDENKLTVLVGHDNNMASLMFCLGFKPYKLSQQLEDVPVGSKLVFQKWSDGVKDFLKVEFVYLSWNQMRGSEEVTSSNPPKNITMYFEEFEADENGMYPWSLLQKNLN